MPVREFHGELDKPSRVKPFTGELDTMTVRLPDGTLLRNVPVGTSKSEIMRRVGLAVGAKQDDMVPVPEGTKARFKALQGPGYSLPDEYSKKDAAALLPIAGGIAGGLAVPGPGWGALALSSLAAAGGAGAGELGRQKLMDEPLDPSKAFKRGAVEGAGNLIGGGVIKGLGKFAEALFSSRLDDGMKVAADAAGEMKAPFPVGQVKPSTLQKATSQLILGRIGDQRQANRVAQFLNQKVGTLTQKAQVFDEAALKGQTFLREVFGEGETAIRNAFTKYGATVGKDTQIPMANTLVGVRQAAERLEARGQTSGGLYQRLRTILKKLPQSLTTEELDELYGGVIKQSFSSRGRAGGEGRILLDAITQDLDNFGTKAGVSFGTDIAAANKVREQYRALRDIPQLERLSEGIGEKFATRGSIDWMNTLFRKENGKALAKLRELNPELYHDLADAWLARHIDSFSQNTQGTMGRVLNGERLRTWFEQNSDTIREVMGKPQYKALDNFTVYAKYMSSAARKADVGGTPMQAMAAWGVSGGFGGLALATGNVPLLIPTEAAAFVLARGVTDPSSTLFRVFTEGFLPATRTSMLRIGQLSGQAAASGSARE